MKSRMLVLLLLGALTASACGARLSDEQRAAGISQFAAAGGDTSGASGPSGSGGGAIDLGTGADTAGVIGGSGGGGIVAGTGGSTGGGSTGGGSTGGGSSSGGSSGGSAAAQRCTSGGATDTGIEANKITIATISDITGPVPGLFKSTHQAVQAYAAKVNAEGGVCGRGIDVKLLDSKSDSAENRAAVLQVCKQAFALVGSMSAFDDAGGAAVDDCGIPEISATVTSKERLHAAWEFPAFPNNPNNLAVGNAKYIADTYPDAVKKAGLLWLAASVTRNNAAARKAAWEKVGFDFVYEQEVQVLEANYTPFILDMQSQGIEYVTMVADNNNIARLMKAAAQQGWRPTVWDWDSVAYDPKFIDQAGSAANGAFVFVSTAMFEESSGNPAMQEYLTWLQRVAPGAKPDYFGELAWSAAGLFVAKMREIGAEPTRDKLKAALAATGEWDASGLHGPHTIGKKLPTTCFLTMEIQQGAFVRKHPAQPNTWDCDRAGRVQV